MEKQEYKYNLKLTERQAKLLSWGCDNLCRIICGQDWTYRDFMKEAWEKRCKEATGQRFDEEWDGGWQNMHEDAEKMTKEMKKRFWGLDGNAMYGLGYDDTSDILFDIHQVIRHQLWLDKPEDERSNFTVDSDNPMKSGSEPLAEISSLTK